MLLQQMSYERCQEIIADEMFMARIKETYALFQDYMKQPMDDKIPSVAYFSMEYGLCNCLKIYSGGLGVLAGDYIKQASDSRVNMTAVGFSINMDIFRSPYLSTDSRSPTTSRRTSISSPSRLFSVRTDSRCCLEVPYPGRIVYAPCMARKCGPHEAVSA